MLYQNSRHQTPSNMAIYNRQMKTSTDQHSKKLYHMTVIENYFSNWVMQQGWLTSLRYYIVDAIHYLSFALLLVSALKHKKDRMGTSWMDGVAVRHTTLVVMGRRGCGKFTALKILKQWLLDVLVNADGSKVKMWDCGECNVMETGYITLLQQH